MTDTSAQGRSTVSRRTVGVRQSDGMKLLSAVVRDAATAVLGQVDARWFTDAERPAYEFINTYYRRFGRMPSQEAMLDNSVHLPDVVDPVDYFMQRCQNRAMYNVVSANFQELNAALRNVQMAEVLRLMRLTISQATSLSSTRDLSTIELEANDFLDAYEDDKYLTGLKGITTGYAPVDEHTNGLQPGDVGILVGRPNMGKALQYHTPTLMADGTWKKHGELQVGDKLASIDGQANEVLQLHPQGVIANYHLTLSDGRSVEACADHLWRVYYREWNEPRILKTSEIQELLTKKRYQKRLWIDRVSGDFGERKTFSIDPYVMGCMLGDGAMTQQARISSADTDLIKLFNMRLPLGICTEHMDGYDYVVVGGMNKLLRQYGLMGSDSYTKFVPEVYKSACREQRLDLLRGLLDTDGTVSKEGHVSFCSVSEQLATDVQGLARSLGYWAKLKRKVRCSGASYDVSIRGTGKEELFLLDRKRQRIINSQQKEARLTIDSIEYSGEFDSQCITVSHPTHLYVVDGYTVTHNTYLFLHMVISAWLSGKSILVVSMEMSTQQLVRRIVAIMAGIDPYFIHRGRLSYHAETHMRDVIRNFGDLPPIHFVAGNFRKTISDIDNYVLEVMPDAIYIDGGYLVGSGRSSKGAARHEKLTEVIEDMKAMATDRQRPVVTTVQFNREVRKNTKTSMDLAQIAGSDAVGQIASLVMGIQQGPAGNRTGQRVVEVLKNREGELLKFLTDFKFSPPSFGYAGMYTDEGEVQEEQSAAHSSELRQSMI